MEITKRSLFISLIISFVCLLASVACAFVLDFNLVSLILLGCVTVTVIVTSIITWRVAANKNK